MTGCGSFIDPSRFRSIQNKSCDIVVIGGGINGAAVARDAALRGLQVVLLEKCDFGSGASTKTSKLAHGGLRYLEQLEFRLVKESLEERTLLLQNAPHLVHPLPFIMPIYSFSPRPMWQVALGLNVYDFLSRKSNLSKHRMLSREEAIAHFPGLAADGLKGGCEFYDAWMRDNRLVIENVLGAEQAGASVLNYVRADGFAMSQGRINGVHFKDLISGEEGVISCRAVVNAAGAWSNQVGALDGPQKEYPLLEPTKGIHIVIPQISGKHALLLRAPQDGRVFFVIPWEEYSLLGTTDTFYNGSPDGVSVEKSDIAYLSSAFNAHFPNVPLNGSNIVATFAGLRPLAAKGHRPLFPSFASRTQSIELSDAGMITILGGKFTTHRRIAEEAVDKAIEWILPAKVTPCMTAHIPLPGVESAESLARIARDLLTAGLDQLQVDHLLMNYGGLSRLILEIIRRDKEEGRQICPEHPHLFAEVTYAVQSEHVWQLEDWFCRRTSIAYTPCRGEKCLDKVAIKFASLLGWNKGQQDAALAAYRHKISSEKATEIAQS